MKTIFVLTRAINEYDQDGDYFVAAFETRPTEAQLAAIAVPPKRAAHVLSGGGRVDSEEEWFYLIEYPLGTLYEAA